MIDQNTQSSGQTGRKSIELTRKEILETYLLDVQTMLLEKAVHYGEAGGFHETNSNGDYIHAIGEAKLKLTEYLKFKRERDLIKALTWLYLIYEAEHKRA